MSRIESAFQNKKVFISFVTAGDPDLDKTLELVLAMEQAGAGIVEIGIPFSDPVAEGPVIQNANIRAQKNAVTTDDVFALTKKIREKSEIPLIYLTYLNPVFTYGYDRFFNRCKEVGADGVIIPDLPMEERPEVLPYANENGIDLISMIAPTSCDRVEKIARQATGFIYLVSSMGVTGERSEIQTGLEEITARIQKVTDVPVAVGFGISTPQQAKEICSFANGAIVGSKIVRIIEEYGSGAVEPVRGFVNQMVAAIAE